MNTFPITKKPSLGQYSESIYKPAIKHEFESNYVMSRPRSSRATRKFKMGWIDLSTTEMNILEQFFIENQGNEFQYTNPFGQTFVVYFGSDNLPDKTPIRVNGEYIWSCKGLTLEEK